MIINVYKKSNCSKSCLRPLENLLELKFRSGRTNYKKISGYDRSAEFINELRSCNVRFY